MNVRSYYGQKQKDVEEKIIIKAESFLTRNSEMLDLLAKKKQSHDFMEAWNEIILNKEDEYNVSSNHFPICTAKSIIFT